MYAMEQTLHVNPTREDRKPTNTPFIWVFGFIVFVWLVVVIKVLVGEPSQEFDQNQNQNTHPTFPTIEDKSSQDFDANYETTFSTMEDESSQKFDEKYQTHFPPLKREYSKGMNKKDFLIDFHILGDESPSESDDDYHTLSRTVKKMTVSFTGTFLMCTVLSGAVAVGYTYYLSLPQGKFAIYGAMVCLCFWMTFIPLVALTASFLLLETILAIIVGIFIITYAAYLITSFLCARGVGVNAIFEIIRDSSRALTNSPMILLFTLGVSLIIILITIFAVYISERIVLSKNGVYIYITLNFFGAKTLTNFFTNLIHMAISEYAVDWFWTKDQHSSSFTIRRNLSRTFSYHLGTVAYASIPLVSHIASAFQIFKCRDSDKDIIKIYNVYTRFFSQLGVTLYVTDYGLIQTSIYGYDYGTAILAAHDIVAQNNHELNLAVSEVTIMLAVIGSFFITSPFSYGGIHHSIYSPFILFTIVFTSAVRALLVNKMIIKYTSDALQGDCETAQKVITPELETPVDV